MSKLSATLDTPDDAQFRFDLFVIPAVGNIYDDFIVRVARVRVVVDVVCAVIAHAAVIQYAASDRLHVYVEVTERQIFVESEYPADRVIVNRRVAAGKIVRHRVRRFRAEIESAEGFRSFRAEDVQPVVVDEFVALGGISG